MVWPHAGDLSRSRLGRTYQTSTYIQTLRWEEKVGQEIYSETHNQWPILLIELGLMGSL